MASLRSDVSPRDPSVRRRRLRLARVAAGATLLLGVTVASVAGAAPAGAVVTTVGGSCGFHLGTPLGSGALGSLGFEFPAFPADPHQVCSVTVTGTATLGPVSGPAFTNVAGNGGSATFTIQFTGGPLPPAIVWVWGPHCADPPAPTVITLTIDGQSAASAAQPADSCVQDFGGSSSLSFSSVEPSFLWYGVGLASTPDNIGYWGVTAAGDIHGVGDAVTPASQPRSVAPVVGIVADPVGGVVGGRRRRRGVRPGRSTVLRLPRRRHPGMRRSSG